MSLKQDLKEEARRFAREFPKEAIDGVVITSGGIVLATGVGSALTLVISLLVC